MKRTLSILLSSLFAGGVIVGCGSPSTGSGNANSTSSAANSTAIYGDTSQVMIFWDPSTSFSNEIVAMNNMYQTLLKYNPTTNTFTPVLATSYEKSKDSLTWTFSLRHDVHFHSGKLMTSADVKNSIQRTIQLRQGAAYIWDSVKSIDTPDQYTVVFHLKYPAPLDLSASAPYAAYIFNTDELKQHGDKWFSAGHEDGTGPYMSKSWSSNQPLVVTKFSAYWGGWSGSHYDNVIFKTVSDANTKAQMIKSGQLTYADMLPVQQLEALKSDKNIAIVQTPSFQNLIAFFNTKNEHLKNPLVREALSDAFPYDQVINDVMHKQAHQSYGPIPAGLWGYDSSLPQYQFNLTEAQKLLTQAGIKPGSLSLTLTYAAGDANEQQIATLYKAMLSQIGVNLTVRSMPWDAQWNLAKATDPNQRQDIFMMYWWPDYANPYSFLYNLFHTESTINFNMSYYSNPQYDKLIDQANVVAGVSREEAIKQFNQAQEILVKDTPAIWVYDVNYERAISSSMQGFVDNPAYPGVVFWYDVHPQ